MNKDEAGQNVLKHIEVSKKYKPSIFYNDECYKCKWLGKRCLGSSKSKAPCMCFEEKEK